MTIEADAMCFRIIGKDEMATRISELTTGREVAVSGELIVNTWKTEEGREHESWEILATNLATSSATSPKK